MNSPSSYSATPAAKKKVLVAFDGSAASAVVVSLLSSQGNEVTAVFFQSGPSEFKTRCSQFVEPKEIEALAAKLKVPLTIIDTRELFEAEVADVAVHEALSLRTPNPCVLCNRQIRFRGLVRTADRLGIEWIATGHYAQVIHNPTTGVASLLRASDPTRDQSYFLFLLDQSILKRTLMPVGGLTQNMILRMAAGVGLEQGVATTTPKPTCWVSDPTWATYMDTRIAETLRVGGTVMTREGVARDKHDALYKFRVGDLFGTATKPEEVAALPVVTGHDLGDGSVFVGQREELRHAKVVAHRASWIQPLDPVLGARCSAVIEPYGKQIPCHVTGFLGGDLEVEFEQPREDLRPGYPIVFYNENEVIGGAWITKLLASS
jgi:tRNA-specific 2-thiouridylase